MIPLDSAVKVVMIRCLNTGRATALMSSKATAVRPASSAFTLAPSTSVCAARGLAPKRRNWLAIGVANCPPGWVASTMRTA